MTLRYRTLRENVCSVIRTKIFRHELAPGARIKENELAEEFGVSRGPIREALRQLEQEGLIEYSRNAGCKVKTITSKDLYEVYILRMFFELIAIKSCHAKLTEEQLTELKKALDSMKTIGPDNPEGILDADYAFHGYIAKLSGMEKLQKFWDELSYGISMDIYQILDKVPERIAKCYDNHKPVYEALASGDEELSCSTLYKHYMNNIQNYIDNEETMTKDIPNTKDLLKNWVE